MGQEDEELITRPSDLGLQVAGQVAVARRGEDGAELSIQGPALGGERRGGQVGDALGQGEYGSQPELQSPGHGIVADLDDVCDVAGEMGEAGLVHGGMTLLCGVAVRDPHRGPVAVHHLPHHDGAPRRRSLVDDRLGRMEDPMVSVAALDAHAGLVRCDHRGPA